MTSKSSQNQFQLALQLYTKYIIATMQAIKTPAPHVHLFRWPLQREVTVQNMVHITTHTCT